MPLILLRTYDNYVQANLVYGFLQDSGIVCFLQDEYSATINPVLTNAIGGIKLLVSADDAEQAVELLEITEKQ